MSYELGLKLSEIIEYVDKMVPNAFTPEVKVRWISELDGTLALELLMLGDASEFRYPYPEALGWHVLVAHPFDNIYELYVQSKIDYANAEYDKYANSVTVYNARMNEFMKWFLNKYAASRFVWGGDGALRGILSR